MSGAEGTARPGVAAPADVSDLAALDASALAAKLAAGEEIGRAHV